ncbi:uncharacterized protein ACIBXB_020623 isoform 1-T1 [Morphnus guianensis]
MSLLTWNLVATTAWFVVRKPIRDFWVEQHKTSHFHCKGKAAEQEITLAAVSLWRAQISRILNVTKEQMNSTVSESPSGLNGSSHKHGKHQEKSFTLPQADDEDD